MKLILTAATLAAGAAYSFVGDYRTKAAEDSKLQEARELMKAVVSGKATAQGVNDDALAYFFRGPEVEGACVVATASRKTLGPAGTSDTKHAKRGLCADRDGTIAAFDDDGRCVLTCRPDLLDALGPKAVQ